MVLDVYYYDDALIYKSMFYLLTYLEDYCPSASLVDRRVLALFCSSIRSWTGLDYRATL